MTNCKVNQNQTSSCGCSSRKDQQPVEQSKDLHIDFLYIDLDVCTRCKGTEHNLHEAIEEVSDLLNSIGYHVLLNKVRIENEEEAEQYHFISSPTIRINGRDLALTTKESKCESCGTITGTEVDCRVWIFEGSEYTEAPKALIKDAILREIYNPAPDYAKTSQNTYVLPDNLRQFFNAGRKHQQKEPSSCCDTRASCC
ncbi:MAG: DUF2703 domain-containing protein [Bacillaceae bacterium]|nr:DUF2703 domain-containing protein [Bacillaceae bacterium]